LQGHPHDQVPTNFRQGQNSRIVAIEAVVDRKKDGEEISISKVIQPRVIQLQTTARVSQVKNGVFGDG
jgi:hypothetical protein